MTGRLRFTLRARDDLRNMGAYIAKDDVRAAARFVASLKEACLRLAQNPLIGRNGTEYADGARCFPVRGRLVIYLPDDNGVLILRIIHGARDIHAAMDD